MSGDLNVTATRARKGKPVEVKTKSRGHIKVDGVSKAFADPLTGDPRYALKTVDLDVVPGEFVTIVGASGCGKTTLLRLIGGLETPTKGQVQLDGRTMDGPNPNMGFVFQSDALMPWRSVLANVVIGHELRGMGKAEARELGLEALALVGLENWTSHMPHELSGGMRQRVNLARAITIDPGVLLMDEPFAALDAQTREVMQHELCSLHERIGATVVFVTHQIEEAVYLGDRIVVLGANPGHVREIVESPADRTAGLESKHDAEFTACVNQIWKMIGSEVAAGVKSELTGTG